MRKKLILLSWILLLISNLYLLKELTKPKIYLPKLSSEINNPISIVKGLRICIDPKFQDAYCYISLFPYVFAIFISFFMLIGALCIKNRCN